MVSQPINEGGQSPGAPRYKEPPSARKYLCHEIITDTLLTSDTLTVSGECYDIINSKDQRSTKVQNLAAKLSFNSSVIIIYTDC